MKLCYGTEACLDSVYYCYLLFSYLSYLNFSSWSHILLNTFLSVTCLWFFFLLHYVFCLATVTYTPERFRVWKIIQWWNVTCTKTRGNKQLKIYSNDIIVSCAQLTCCLLIVLFPCSALFLLFGIVGFLLWWSLCRGCRGAAECSVHAWLQRQDTRLLTLWPVLFRVLWFCLKKIGE